MAFRYAQKETYSQEDLDNLLVNHSKYIKDVELKGYVSPGAVKKLQDELAPFKQEARKTHLQSLVGDLTDESKLSDALALAGITEDDSDETVIKKVTDTITSRKWLQPDVVSDTTANVVKEQEVPVKETTEAPAGKTINGVAF